MIIKCKVGKEQAADEYPSLIEGTEFYVGFESVDKPGAVWGAISISEMEKKNPPP
eukprot:CAMPEP_0171656136 /NCGR_PEP_ID=MMETSP0990-20121206/41377_1 /TAXON_ID=483369 /ORGANISM="non described non described, Strain CCMP2098" /LENGTH=54 /DNA_ID=CAMNT_0012236503 /DNA_START=24 /DNA_END=185 /DNA_ORIENTATION=-